ncbi:hypothetical protein B0H19DRAFT_113371 [Mycena capillaripes]|nr:hypothetical protein B0H19DRAFT_113371 [Mycena capillaripes]
MPRKKRTQTPLLCVGVLPQQTSPAIRPGPPAAALRNPPKPVCAWAAIPTPKPFVIQSSTNISAPASVAHNPQAVHKAAQDTTSYEAWEDEINVFFRRQTEVLSHTDGPAHDAMLSVLRARVADLDSAPPVGEVPTPPGRPNARKVFPAHKSPEKSSNPTSNVIVPRSAMEVQWQSQRSARHETLNRSCSNIPSWQQTKMTRHRLCY